MKYDNRQKTPCLLNDHGFYIVYKKVVGIINDGNLKDKDKLKLIQETLFKMYWHMKTGENIEDLYNPVNDN